MTTHQRPSDWEEPVVLPNVAAPQRVLVPFDGSHASERALAWAALLAASGAELIVMVGYEQPMTMRGRGALFVDDMRRELEQEARELAAEAVEAVLSRGISARALVVKGDVARGILDVVDSEQCELVLLGRQGLSAEMGGLAGAVDRFRDMLQGGVSDKVIRHCPVPVVVVP